jgi:hypothetical protein
MHRCAHFMHYFLRGAWLYAFLPIAIDLVLEQACQNSPVQADPEVVNRIDLKWIKLYYHRNSD